ncbi:uracil permease [Pseudodesulfovibrio sp. JC047]|uniref:uracil-xanthine permease family protein n=1 Tax=Pseudodesulfovibrio sp. JC047 TaxID=2683199 RepID=UPI0013D05008|nr:uracil-xanthine permease family protein [Pseudodesulfovibrio sp. JC047]NDV18020.1 uracil permease [Pseudodesulfovibrio sp. JC047]
MSEFHSTEYNFRPKDALLGAQMLFVAFGALVLVPILTGIDSNVALFTAGIGTLIFQIITKGKVPVFLASSFAFLPPLFAAQQGQFSYSGIMCGLVAAGFLYIIISLLIRFFGSDFLHKLLPPIVTGPVIMLIGLILAPTAVNMSLGHNGMVWIEAKNPSMIIAGVALLTTVLTSLLGKGWFKLIPILCGITAGYACALIMDATGITASMQQTFMASAVDGKIAGMGIAPWMDDTFISFATVKDAPWFALPNFSMPTWDLDAILFVVPIAIAPAIEHFGDVLAIGSISGKDYVEDPGIQNTMLGDGVATSVACMLGGPPNTTYSEVSGAVALTRAFNPAIMTWAAITAILLAFVGKLGGLLGTIPMPVMGGIMLLLFGAITVIGLSTLVRSQLDLMQSRNMIIVSIIMVFGLGGMVLNIGITDLKGIGLGAIAGVILNLVLPGKAEAEKTI